MLETKMFEIMLRKRFSPVLTKYFSISLKASYSDSSLVKSEPKLKSLVESDFTRVIKTPFKKNFVEKLFVNELQLNVLEYPEMETIDEVERLRKYCQHAQKLIIDKDNTEGALTEVDTKTAVSTLKKHELTGFKIPKIKKGFGFLNSEYAYMQETLGADPSLSKTISENEDFGVQLIDRFGNEEQKEQYLRKLLSGETLSSFAHLEFGTLIPLGEDVLNTKAVLSSDGQSYVISGTKSWVYNAGVADLLILSACVKNPEGGESKPTLFLVDKNQPGVVIHEQFEPLGMKKLSICDVTFNDVVVPSTSVLGNLDEGGEIIKKILCEGKLNIGSQCLAIMRKLFNESVKHCLHTEFFDKDKYSKDYFRYKITMMATKIYEVESMTYLLTGRLDFHTEPDVYLESLIAKIFSSEALQYIIKNTIEILGNEIFTNNDDLCELIKDSQFYVTCEDTNDHLRLVLASAGVNYAMNHRGNPLKKIFEYFTFLISNNKLIRTEDISFKKKAKGYLHLVFFRGSYILEDSIQILYDCTQYLIKKHGDDVFHKSSELKYLADIAINVYVMVATLGRASRAYCLSFWDQETDRECTNLLVRKLGMRNKALKKAILKPKTFDGLPQISKSLESNKYSDIYSVYKNLTVRN